MQIESNFTYIFIAFHSHWWSPASNLYLIEAGNELIENAITNRIFIEYKRQTNALILILHWQLIFGIIFYI